MILWRAADNDYIGHTASFASCRIDAEAYLDNAGFGGSTLFQTEVEPENVLDLYDSADSIEDLLTALGMDELPSHVVADSADVAVCQLQSELEAAGFEWVRVRDTYPTDCETWTFISGDEPEVIEV